MLKKFNCKPSLRLKLHYISCLVLFRSNCKSFRRCNFSLRNIFNFKNSNFHCRCVTFERVMSSRGLSSRNCDWTTKQLSYNNARSDMLRMESSTSRPRGERADRSSSWVINCSNNWNKGKHKESFNFHKRTKP